MRPTIIERGHDKWMTALSLDPLASGNQPQDHIAVALAGTAQEAQPVDHKRRQPDIALTVGVGPRFVRDRAGRQGGGDSLEGGLGDSQTNSRFNLLLRDFYFSVC